MEIWKVFVLSTAHATKEDLEKAQIWITDMGAADQYGVWIYAAIDREYFANRGFSDAFWNCLNTALQNECTYVRFDRDGPVLNSLETFDW